MFDFTPKQAIKLIETRTKRFTNRSINTGPCDLPSRKARVHCSSYSTTLTPPMDPTFSSEWSVSEIKVAKSLIASRNTSSNLASDDDASNKKHSDIVDELQARFPWKGKHEVIGLYVDLTMEMINTPSEVGDDGLVMDDDNFGMPVEEQPQMKYTGRFWTREEHRSLILFISTVFGILVVTYFIVNY